MSHIINFETFTNYRRERAISRLSGAPRALVEAVRTGHTNYVAAHLEAVAAMQSALDLLDARTFLTADDQRYRDQLMADLETRRAEYGGAEGRLNDVLDEYLEAFEKLTSQGLVFH
ncbi:hypothetical protein [Methylobacterium oryzisoli]|uniref:hypothetical protein n=1 Tax=Methylobacterium oryzisoli TaxID=3385502 RepID=UPI003892A2A9